jgi:hypothetical protein
MTNQTITIEGTIQWIEMGTGTWGLVTDSGETYELYGISLDPAQEGLRVEIQGRIREDVMTLAMIGPVLEVQELTTKFTNP